MNSLITNFILTSYWAITPEAYKQMLNFVSREFNTEDLTKAMHGNYAPFVDGKDATEYKSILPGFETVDGYRGLFINENVAVLTVFGPLVPRSANMSMSSNGLSTESLSNNFNYAMGLPSIDTIILKYDTPGGNVTGTAEFSSQIFTARGKGKKIVSYVTGLGASAGFWHLSAADIVIADPTALVGSIGIITGTTDRTVQQEKSGIKEIDITSSVSPAKNLPLSSDAGRASAQKMVDDIANIFVSDVAKNRGVSVDKVLSDFGKGGILIASSALKAGMIDKIDTFSNVINSYLKNNLIGGNSMTVTYAGIKADSPDVFKAIFEEGAKSVVDDVKALDEAHTKGYTEACESIKKIEGIAIPGAEKIISENKFIKGMTEEKIALLIVQNQASLANTAGAVADKDGANLLADLANTDTSTDMGDTDAKAVEEHDRQAIIKIAVDAANSKRK